MHIEAPALLVSVRKHGENGIIARTLTEAHGLIAAYVQGGQGRQARPVLQIGNLVHIRYRSRTDAGLGQMAVELRESRFALAREPLSAAALEWLCGLISVSLPERQPFPAVYAAANALLAALEHAPAARGWVQAMVQFERLLLAELGFALALDCCIVTGARDQLAWVSPKSAAAVSVEAARGHEHRLLALPPFLIGRADPPEWPDLIDGLTLTGHFIDQAILAQHRGDIGAARLRMVDRIKRVLA